MVFLTKICKKSAPRCVCIVFILSTIQALSWAFFFQFLSKNQFLKGFFGVFFKKNAPRCVFTVFILSTVQALSWAFFFQFLSKNQFLKGFFATCGKKICPQVCFYCIYFRVTGPSLGPHAWIGRPAGRPIGLKINTIKTHLGAKKISTGSKKAF